MSKKTKSRKARYIERLVDTIADMALRGTEYRVYAFREADHATSKEGAEKCEQARKEYELSILTMKACMAEILEDDVNEVNHLMEDLEVHWKK